MAVLNPAAFHGENRKGPFFEGWYFKLVNASVGQRWCIIPGIYLGKNSQDSHSFIQVLNGMNGKSWYIPFDRAEFKPSPGKFHVLVGQNEFSGRSIKLRLSQENLTISGELSFGSLKPWPVTLWSPGIMGWYAWVPGMECYHGVLSFDHKISGSLNINGESVDFSGGRGYIEKDWGKAMPKAWIWMQTNHFNQKNVSLTASFADIPFGPLSFNGFIIGLMIGSDLYRFATYTSARIEKIVVDTTQVSIIIADKRKRLEIIAWRKEGSALQAPTFSQMDRRIMESLSAEIDVKLLIKEGKGWKTIFNDHGKFAGLEVVGELDLKRF